MYSRSRPTTTTRLIAAGSLLLALILGLRPGLADDRAQAKAAFEEGLEQENLVLVLPASSSRRPSSLSSRR